MVSLDPRYRGRPHFAAAFAEQDAKRAKREAELAAYRAAFRDKMPCLYRHYDATGRLLYVGISFCFANRMKEHFFSHWYDEIARVDIERFPTREAACEAERKAIRSEKPLYNDGKNRPDSLCADDARVA
jgi:GIY-YIG catalytic domain